MTYGDLLAIVRQQPEGSALDRAINGEDAIWSAHMMLTAELFDMIQVLVWQNTKDGHAGRNYPTPLPRPGHRPVKENYAPLPAADMLAWLGWRAPDDASEIDDIE